jgi:hypothetical protein
MLENRRLPDFLAPVTNKLGSLQTLLLQTHIRFSELVNVIVCKNFAIAAKCMLGLKRHIANPQRLCSLLCRSQRSPHFSELSAKRLLTSLVSQHRAVCLRSRSRFPF